MPYVTAERRKELKKNLDNLTEGDLSYLLMRDAIKLDAGEVIDRGMGYALEYIAQKGQRAATMLQFLGAIRSSVIMLKVEGYGPYTWDSLEKLESFFGKKIFVNYELEKRKENGKIC